MKPEPEQFVLAEYDALRREIEQKLSQLSGITRNVAVLSGVIWAWLATNTIESVLAFALVVPPVLSLLFLWNYISLRGELRRLANYIVRIEEAMDLPDGLGWERTIARETWKPTELWQILWWIIICLGNLLGAIWFGLAS